jgi:preprotein translocase subunit SecA
VAGLGLSGEVLDAESLAELGTREAILEALVEAAEAAIAEREERYGPETWALVERIVLLRAIDTLWVDHLTELDDFRRGVGLRGYAGTDPLVEFKREAFKLYEELRGFIRHQVASTIFRVNVQRQEPPPPRPMPSLTPEQLAALRASGSDGGATAASIGSTASVTPVATQAPSPVGATVGASAAASLLPGMRPAGAGQMRLQHGDETVGRSGPGGATSGAPAGSRKIGRNDPCWCGSGQKYKRCHGR